MAELLQELRVAQTGVQVFFAFLLTIPFAPGFERLDATQRDVYAFDVLAVVLSMSLLVAPVAIHRAVFGERMRPELVAVAHVLTIGGLLMLMIAVILGVILISTVVFPSGGVAGGLWLPVAAGVSLFACWVLLPLAMRLRSLRR